MYGRDAIYPVGGGSMKQLSVLRKFAPEIEDVERRHSVLQSVVFAQPIGRRALAGQLGWPERMVRKEIDFLREAGLFIFDAARNGRFRPRGARPRRTEGDHPGAPRPHRDRAGTRRAPQSQAGHRRAR